MKRAFKQVLKRKSMFIASCPDKSGQGMRQLSKNKNERMKKITLISLALLFSLLSWAQIITTTPTFVTQSGGAIDIIYDATLGTAGLKDYTGTDGVYAHTGVITNAVPVVLIGNMLQPGEIILTNTK